jgi:hypothetical protein
MECPLCESGMHCEVHDGPLPEEEMTPVELGAPIEPLSDADIVRYARGVITQEYMLANANDIDWYHSLILLIAHWNPRPENISSLFLVPMAPHAGGRWLNGRVPGVTISAVPVAMESVDALIAKCDEFYRLLHPDE